MVHIRLNPRYLFEAFRCYHKTNTHIVRFGIRKGFSIEQFSEDFHGFLFMGTGICLSCMMVRVGKVSDSSCNCQQESEPVGSSHISCACIFLIQTDLNK